MGSSTTKYSSYLSPQEVRRFLNRRGHDADNVYVADIWKALHQRSLTADEIEAVYNDIRQAEGRALFAEYDRTRAEQKCKPAPATASMDLPEIFDPTTTEEAQELAQGLANLGTSTIEPWHAERAIYQDAIREFVNNGKRHPRVIGIPELTNIQFMEVLLKNLKKLNATPEMFLAEVAEIYAYDRELCNRYGATRKFSDTSVPVSLFEFCQQADASSKEVAQSAFRSLAYQHGLSGHARGSILRSVGSAFDSRFEQPDNRWPDR